MHLNGWDTVIVSDLHPLNAALKASTEKLLSSFSASQNDFRASGKFGAWSLVVGATGDNVMLETPITSGEMQMNDESEPIDISGTRPQSVVTLHLVPSSTNNALKELKFNFKDVSSDAGKGAVYPHDVLDSGCLTFIQKAALGNAVAKAFVNNADDISFVFASINPLNNSKLAWLEPKTSRYSFLNPSGAPPALAIFSTTSVRDVSKLSTLVGPKLLSGAGDAGLAISEDLFLQYILAPVLLHGLGASGDLKVQNSALVNTGSLSLPKVEKAGESYHPKIEHLSAVVTDTQITVTISGSCDMHLGIHMDFKASSDLKVSLSADGKALQFDSIGTPTFHKDVHIPWYDHLFDIVAAVSEIILQVTVSAISKGISGSVSSKVVGDDIVKYAPSIVSWAGKDAFGMRDVFLADSLCCRGILQ
ncbi:hypothetical protein BWQ96_05170 [Gracilariopsis chorda]|uniref:Protein OrfX2/OrfX3/P47 domain-containing protein n=1 Tax=Gracilariopsis chorda TaxID=448386 RepID=A0A2V3ISG4_9FLOR|nr:hypothetical protein BWQ96_05170 [Gracilariopsis chorda]|eukprot:PXF45068.1 hypothetical protein BWQ96_05170 [Gracilariopsis chorda]